MERERITISIKKKVLGLVDKSIDGVNIRNRSHAIETLISRAFNSAETKDAVILIGGNNALKMIPSVKENLKELKKQSFTKVYIAAGYLADKIIDKIGNGEEFGLEINYLTEGEGSAGALLPLKNIFNKTFFVFNTDKKVNLDLNKLFEYHKKYQPKATISTDNIDELKGVYLLEPEIFQKIPKKDFSMLENDIFPSLLKEGSAIINMLHNVDDK